nr:hypothetical protein [Tanacetum cinerariifolium]
TLSKSSRRWWYLGDDDTKEKMEGTWSLNGLVIKKYVPISIVSPCQCSHEDAKELEDDDEVGTMAWIQCK